MQLNIKNFNSLPIYPKKCTVVDLKCSITTSSFENKEIIFCVDVSASMEKTLKYVKRSLLAFHMLTSDVNIHLITFSNTAKHVWSKNSNISFDKAVEMLEVEAQTNISDGVLLAYKLKDLSKVTWIVILTDGVPNKGLYQTPESFVDLKKAATGYTKLITLGFGQAFSHDVLTNLGTFSYIKNEAMIPVVIGALAYEYTTAWGFDAYIHVDNITNVPEIGVLYNERKYMCICKDDSFDLLYIDIATMEKRTVMICSRGKIINMSDVLTHYYFDAASKIIEKIYRYANIHNILGVEKEVKKELETWTHVESIDARESVLNILDRYKKLKTDRDMKDVLSYTCMMSIDYSSQQSYINENLMTPGKKESIKFMMSCETQFESLNI